MSKLIFSNNASALLAASIDDDDTSIQVASGFGDFFPSPGTGEYFVVVLRDADGDYEVCHCTARSDDLLTVERGKEGTSAQSWTNTVTRVEHRITKGTLEGFIQRTGDTMSGDLDMDGNDLKDAVITGSGTKMTGGQIVGVPIRGKVDDDSNEILVPSDGGTPTIGGSEIVTEGNVAGLLPIGMIIMWYGSLSNIPTGWALCDGTNGTPDMRGLVPIGAGGSITLGQSVGSSTGTTSSNGSHDHGGETGGTSLTVSQMPSHHHKLLGTPTSGETTPLSGIGSEGISGHRGAGTYAYREDAANGIQLVEDTGDGDDHDHSISSDGSHTHTVNLTPPSRGVYFIMKVS